MGSGGSSVDGQVFSSPSEPSLLSLLHLLCYVRNTDTPCKPHPRQEEARAQTPPCPFRRVQSAMSTVALLDGFASTRKTKGTVFAVNPPSTRRSTPDCQKRTEPSDRTYLGDRRMSTVTHACGRPSCRPAKCASRGGQRRPVGLLRHEIQQQKPARSGRVSPLCATVKAGPSAAEHMASVSAAVSADPAALQELVEDAVVWASQHGLVGRTWQ